jgi:radical SAM superfamily enzyme YgiQ (UPF0313 family)
MKILIINPPAYRNTEFIREGRCMQTKSSWAALWMPLSLCYIAAVLRKKGHQIKIIDCIAEKKRNEDLKELTASFLPDVVFLNTAIPSIEGDMKTAEAIKDVLPEIKIVIIGVFPSLFEKESLSKFPSADFAIVDEPEWVASSLVSALEEKSDLADIRGLIYRENSEIKITPRQNLQENRLEELPFPARDLLNNDAYKLPTTGEKFTLLSVGRGCSESCIYCVANLYYGKRFRKRTAQGVADEIEECINKYEIKSFLFWGESFTTDPAYGESICDEIIRRKLSVTWSTTSRVDTLNPVLLAKMKSAGCILLGLGIESVDQEVLNRARKRITTSQITDAIEMVKSAGISTMGHFVFGLPGDTRESAFKSINFALKNVDFAQFYCAIPYPKTELGKLAEDNGWIKSSGYEDLDLTKSVMGNDHLSPDEVKKLRDTAFRRFYFRPVMIWRAFREIRSAKALFSLLNFINWIKPRRFS